MLSHGTGGRSWSVVLAAPEDVSDYRGMNCGDYNVVSRTKEVHRDCVQVVFPGQPLLDGVCTNCYHSDNTQACSFRRKFLKTVQTAGCPSQEISLTLFSGSAIMHRGVVPLAGVDNHSASEIIATPPDHDRATRLVLGKPLYPAQPRTDPTSFAWTSEVLQLVARRSARAEGF